MPLLKNICMASSFRDVIVFFDKLGIYDVVLPFLLVFAVVYAILDKTKILGTEKIDNVEYPKKNINSMVAFVIAFFVVASTKLVETISTALANTVLLLLLIVMFLMLVGAFFKNDEDVFLEGGWRYTFMVIVFVAIILIFLDAIKTDSGMSWLDSFWLWLTIHWSTTAISSIIMFIVLIGLMYWITSPEKSSSDKK